MGELIAENPATHADPHYECEHFYTDYFLEQKAGREGGRLTYIRLPIIPFTIFHIFIKYTSKKLLCIWGDTQYISSAVCQ